MKRRNSIRSLCLAISGTLAFTSACVSTDPMHAEFAWEKTQAQTASETPLGGQALIQRKRELERAQKDVAFYWSTLNSLQERRERGGYIMLSSFMDAYFGLYLDPLLAPKWQSSHPEVMALDVSLRIAAAEMYVQMRDPARAQSVLDDVSQRYKGREGMLVQLPTGEETTLGEAIESLSDRKWWKG